MTTLKRFRMTKFIICLLLGGSLFLCQTLMAQESPGEQKKPIVQVPPPVAQANPVMQIKVVDLNYRPLRNATITTRIITDVVVPVTKIQTDEKGIASLKLPANVDYINLNCTAPGHPQLYWYWQRANKLDPKSSPPGEILFPMQQSMSLGGKVTDEKGQPIAGVSVDVLGREMGSTVFPEGVRYDSWISMGSDAVQTDANGNWHTDDAPATTTKVEVFLRHPDYISEHFLDRKTYFGEQGGTFAQLKNKTSQLKMAEGGIITGKVTDAKGKAVPKAVVGFADSPYGYEETRV
jgi:hypothetical protein